MKYYHVIYNSSQRTQSGAPGLGVRTCTDGTPEEYIKLLDQNGCFSYESGNIKQPNPKALLENGNLILDMPVTYSFVRLYVPSTGKEIFVYLRTVCVGFDYPYYVKFTAARMDNFVTDAYIFEEYPGTEIAQIFYEKPAPDSVSFVPRDPVPSPENEEMKTLSVGSMLPLNLEEKSFVSEELPDLDERIVEVLLGYFEANRKNVPLLIKCQPSEAPKLMADLIRLLPLQLEPNATFMTNYQSEGVKDGYKVFFINEGYQFEYEMTGQFQILDLTQGQIVKTTEADLYRDKIKVYINEKDKVSLDKLSTWLLTPLYSTIRQNSPQVKETMYNYVIEPEKFSLNEVASNKEELWPIMIDYFKKDQKKQNLLNTLLEKDLLSEQDADHKCALLELFNGMVAAGFNVSEIATKNQKAISERLAVSEEYLDSVLSKMKGIANLQLFVDKSVFEDHSEYLDSRLFVKWWPETFQLFYSDEDISKKKILNRMLVDAVPEGGITKVLQTLKTTDVEICDLFADVLAFTKVDYDTVWPILERSLNAVLKENKQMPSEETLVKLNDYVVTPLSMSAGIGNWTDLMLLMSNAKTGKIDESNADRLLKLALKFKNSAFVMLMLEKGLPFFKDSTSELISSVKKFLPSVNETQLLLKAYKSVHKIDYISDVVKTYDVKLKAIEKLAEADPSFLDEEEMDKVRVIVYGKKPAKKKGASEDDEQSKGGFWSKITSFWSKITSVF